MLSSEDIKAVCDLFDTAKKDYAWSCSKVGEMDRLTSDYLHMLELDGLDYKERAKVATKLAACRQERRVHKDTVEILAPLVQFLDSDKGRGFHNTMKEVLGQTRAVEKKMKTRTYNPRVLRTQT